LAGSPHVRGSLKAKPVKYLKLTDIRDRDVAVRDLPFLKRYASGNEEEFRMIYESKSEPMASLDVRISLSCTERVSLSPWIHESLSDHVKDLLRSIEGCAHVPLARSTLISNEEWKELGQTAI
jgi:hypothetical protein